MVATTKQLNNKRRAMRTCDVSWIRTLDELFGSESEHSRENNQRVSYKKHRVCSTDDDEDYEVQRRERVAKRTRGRIKGKTSESTSRTVEKKTRNKGRCGRSEYKKWEINSTSSETNSSEDSDSDFDSDSDSHDLSSSLTSCSPTSVKSSPSTSYDGDNNAKSTTNALAKEKKHFMCHQCKKNDRPAVVKCLKCTDKLYCLRCIRLWYPQFSEEEIAEACPFCLKICNCNACLHSSGIIKTSKRDTSQQEQISHLNYLVHSLFPFVRQIRHDQIQEINIEATIRGTVLQEDDIPETSCSDDERIFCNQCATSIFDVHRSCPSCSYELCLSCSQEIREGNLLGGPEANLRTYSYKGFEYVHGGDPLPCSSIDYSNYVSQSLSEWIANRDRSIPCPQKDRGGCGNGILELRRILPTNWLRNLEEKAESIVKSTDIEMMPCKIPSDSLYKAASRNSFVDNHLYSPSANDLLQHNAITYFRQHWANGEPIIVRDSLQQTPGLSWEPMVMWRVLCESADSNIKAVDCLANCEISPRNKAFLDGGSLAR